MSLVVADMLARHAYQTGDFTLASGQKSNEYLNVKKAMHIPSVAHFISQAMYNAMVAAIGPSRVEAPTPVINAVAGVATGGITLATRVVAEAYDLRRHLSDDRYHDAIKQLTVRLDPKGHGSGGQIDGLDNIDGALFVYLVEDVITTGGSTIKSLTALKASCKDSPVILLGVAAVVDREQGGLAAIKAAFPDIPVSALCTMSQVRTLASVHKSLETPDAKTGR